MSEGQSQRGGREAAAARGGVRQAALSLGAEHGPIALGLVFFVYVFVQNAWVSEDAYVTFRSIEQLFAGNGLRWNPHERVQAYVHPLWFWVQAALRLFSPDVFWNAILASFFACLVSLLALARGLGAARWLALLLLLVSSKSYVDYTSSGLETPLSGLLLVLFFLVLRRIGDAREGAARTAETLPGLAWRLSLLLSLLLLSRLDLVTLVLPAFGWALWHLRGLGPRRLSQPVLLGLAPLALFLVFSLVYFGFLLPNPAYAKLATGLPRARLVAQGLHYVESLRIFDPVLLLVVLGAFVRGVASERPALRAMAFGLPLNIAYVIWVGGDFMTGRFFASAYLFGAILCVVVPWQRGWAAALVLLVVGLGTLSPFSPLRSTPSYYYRTVHWQVGDERGTYFPYASLYAWWTRDPDRVFPDYRFSRDGLRESKKGRRVVTGGNIGMFGYWVGTRKIVVDQLGLADPLLARLPSRGVWRIGHFGRPPPIGYVESLRSGQNLIEDPALHRLYEDLRLITQGDLFRSERFAAILRRNLGLDALDIPKDYAVKQIVTRGNLGRQDRDRPAGAPIPAPEHVP